jgi:hypothetical protein
VNASRPPRIGIDLHRLPEWLQYAIALPVVAAVVTLVWLTRDQHPTPAWMTDYVLPAVTWGGGAALLCYLAYRAARRFRRRK